MLCYYGRKQQGFPMKTLFLDTETAPSKGYFYSRKDNFITPQQIIDTGFFLMCQWSWNDEPVKIKTLPKNKTLSSKDDYDLVVFMQNLVNKADKVVAFNGKRFDMALLQARCAFHNIGPTAPVPIVDPYLLAKRKFKFEANSLDAILQYLGLDRKMSSGGYKTAIGCMNGDKNCWDILSGYGGNDVDILRTLYYRLLPWEEMDVNCALTDKKTDVVICPRCGSIYLVRKGYKHTKTGSYIRYQCKGCGGYVRGRKNIIPKENKNNLMVTL